MVVSWPQKIQAESICTCDADCVVLTVIEYILHLKLSFLGTCDCSPVLISAWLSSQLIYFLAPQLDNADALKSNYK